MRQLAALALLCVPVCAQYTELATTNDGQQVYFSTTLIQRESSPGLPSESRVFRIDGKTLELYAERGSLARTGFSGSGDGASSIQVSGDGQSVAFVLTNICPSGDSCQQSVNRAEVRGRNAQILPGELQSVGLSRSGEWALLVPLPFTSPGGPGQPPVQNTESTLLNLLTKESRTLGMPATFSGRFAVASDGSVLARVPAAGGMQGPFRIGIWKNGALTSLAPVQGGVAFLGMSDNAGAVLASRIDLPGPGASTALPPPELIAFDVKNGTVRTLHKLEGPGAYNLLGFSNDGATALLTTTSQEGSGPLLLADLAAGTVSVLPLPNGEVARNGTLSGSGNAAIVATNSGRILRIPIVSGRVQTIEELIPPTPWINIDRLASPGAVIQIEPPVAGDIDWTNRIRLEGAPLAILGRNGRLLRAQIPWDVRNPADLETTVEYPSTSPLIQRARTFVVAQAPQLVSPARDARGILGGLFIKADFSGYVTETPKPGDIVHMYMTGLGAVRGAVQTGQPAPLSELRPLATDMRCRFTPFGSDTRLLFAGLAPGMIGIYQLTFQFGQEAQSSAAINGMECSFSGNTGFGFIFGSLTAPTP